MPRILITGANSFIGTNFRRFSQFKEIDEISLIDNDPQKINFNRYDVILHLAALVHQTGKIPVYEYFKVNRDLCLEVAENAKKAGVRQFVFLSTAKVYGRFIPGSAPWTEDSPCQPDDAYGQSKYEAEQKLKQLETPDFIISIIRTPVVYGNGVKANMLNLIKLVDTCKILPFRKTENRRCYTYTGNLIAFIDAIIGGKVSGVFIAMDKDPVSTTCLINYIAKALDRKLILFKLPDILIFLGRKIFPKYFDRLYGSVELDNKRTKKILNFDPYFTTEEGITKMIDVWQKDKEK